MDIFWTTLTYVLVIIHEGNPLLQEGQDLKHQGIDFGFNSTHVLLQSILFCGTDLICNKSLLNKLNISVQPASAEARCGSCSCSDDCFSLTSATNCCPDVFFQHGLPECKDVQIVSNKTSRKEVIASCPIGTNPNLSKECTKERSDIDVMFHPPVTSDVTHMSYLNKYCGACNNATNLNAWDIMFECSKEVDFNYLSSYHEILELATVQACNILFRSPNSSRNCSTYSYGKISVCNVTGSWRNYDVQIEIACLSSYFAAIGMFKNMFCAMCNPPEFEEGFLIDECDNSTSIYREACRFLSYQEASFPYKNYYCFICNHGDNSTLYYKDVNLIELPSEVYAPEEERPYQFTFTIAYNANDFNQYMNRLLKVSNLNETVYKPSTEENTYKKEDHYQCSKTFDIDGIGGQHFLTHFNPPSLEDTSPSDTNIIRSINITNLIRMSFAFSGHGTCTPGLLPNYTIPLQKPCSCTIGCRSDCCDDFALKVPWTCIDDRYHRDGKKDFLAIGGCMEDPNIEHLCSGDKSNQFYQAFPVTMKTGYRENYVNFFCYLCNRKTDDSNHANVTENVTKQIEVWPLVVLCSAYVNLWHFHSLEGLIGYVNRSSCVLGFSPPANSSKCSENCNKDQTDIIEKCNKSKKWSTSNEEILYACENSASFRFPRIKLNDIIYKNKFCTICNPFMEDPAEGHCSVFSVHSNVKEACDEFPSINVCHPYKNVFCEMCQNDGVESHCYEELEANKRSIDTLGPTPPPFPEDIVGNFRSTFTLSAYDSDTVIDKPNIECQQYQIYDGYQNTCRNSTCFPGKLLRNDTCVSLLMEASKLRYTLALKLEFRNRALINATVKELITGIRDYISQNINILLSTGVSVEDIISMSKGDCSDTFPKNGEVFLYLKLFINDTVNRDETEQKLLNFTDTTVDWNLSGVAAKVWSTSIMNIKVSRSPESLFLPSFLWKLDKKTQCFVLAETLSHGPAVYRNVLVNPLLTCKQVIVKDGDFGVDWTNIRTKISFLGFSFSAHQFISSENGGVRVCAKEISFYAKTQTAAKNSLSPLSTLTLVCIIISLICLIITFVTYCMFPTLRTVPGMNNMCLVVSLFIAQLLMIVRPSFRSTWLPIVSALSHFSWLSTFLWLQVCSFHVFRVFTAKGQSDFRTKVVVQYSIYAFGSSAVIVVTNIVVSLIVTNGEKTGYDESSALMTYSIAFFATLIAPLALVCVTNIVFYAFTAYKIYSTPKLEKTTGSRVHFSVYVKLFTLTGLSWVLQIIDAFLEMTVFSYLVAILNGLQGLFIFISYVCNGRVWRLYLNVCCKAPFDKSTSNASSKTDTTKI